MGFARGPFLALIAMLLTIALLGIPSFGSGPAGCSELSSPMNTIEGLEIIDIGPPSFNISLRTLDQRQWCVIDLEGGLTLPSSGAPSVPYLSYPLELPYEVSDIKLIRSRPAKLDLPAPIPPGPSVIKFTEENLEELAKNDMEFDASAYLVHGPLPSEPLLWGHAGYTWEEGNIEIRGYGGQRGRVGIKVSTESPGYDIGFRKVGDAYELVADWWGVRGINREQFVQQMAQRYAYHAARAKLAEQGFALVNEEMQEGQRIHLVLRRMV